MPARSVQIAEPPIVTVTKGKNTVATYKRVPPPVLQPPSVQVLEEQTQEYARRARVFSEDDPFVKLVEGISESVDFQRSHILYIPP